MISTFVGLMLIGLAEAPAQPAAAPLPPPKRMTPARARANLGALIGNDDYPRDALRQEQEGTVGFRLNVGADGLVSGCTVTSSSGSPSLDQATCRLLTERARFTPAIDMNGRPAADSVAARIVWRIDRSAPSEPVKAMMQASIVKVTAAGEMSCWRIDDQGPAKPDPCESDSQLPEIARRLGRPIEQTIVVTVTPDGEAQLTYSGDHGEMWTDAEAVITLTADGRADCRVVRNVALGAAAGGPPPPDPCAALPPESRRFKPGPGETFPMVMRFTLTGFMRF